MRPLLTLVGAVVFIDTALYAALAPILADLRDEFGLGKAGAGVLAGAYPVGTVLGALPGGWLTARYGARTVITGALITMSAASAAFALAQGIVAIDVARFLQGLGGAATWTAGLAWIAQAAPSERRGELLGIAIGLAIFGAQFGPVIGTIADAAGREATFLAMAAVGLPLILVARAMAVPPAVVASGNSPRGLVRDRPFLAAVWLTVLASLAFGVIEVLVPLRLDALGASALAIGAAFFVSGGVEAVMSPLVGRITDRSGVAVVVRRATLLAAAGLAVLALPAQAIVLAALLAVTAAGLGALWVPGNNLASVAAERLRVDQGWAFSLNSLAWAGGVAIGALAGGVLADVAGDGLAYGLAAALMLATGVVATRAPKVFGA
jgi:MFS family permease